ncbi:MAG TPA: hypothetical protein VIL87_06150 [Dermatophilaceae bacterium]
MKRTVNTIILAAAVSALSLSLGGAANAASNPAGTGQPTQSCGSATALSSPNGFNSGGFAKAGAVYAGSPGTASSAHAQSGKAVSQYDVACYQISHR